jgi:Icc-related predicted phosphoesterase
VTIYYGSDFHGSSVVWRKFVNAARFYEADVLVMGGDLTGKAIVPIVETERGYRVQGFGPGGLVKAEDLADAEKRIEDVGFYPVRLSESACEELLADQTAMDALFEQVMLRRFKDWLRLADERLRGTGVRVYAQLGNGDLPALQPILDESTLVVNSESHVAELGEGYVMYSCGWTSPTPWLTPREQPEAELEKTLLRLVSGADTESRAVFNFHCPPYSSGLDLAPRLDANLKPVVQAGQVMLEPVGSRAVRTVLEKYQPALGLHGHIHESRGVSRVGRTICLNPGSAYGEGILHGALVTLDKRKGIRDHMLFSG